MEAIPSVTFDPEDYTPDEAPRAWRRFFHLLHDVTPLQAPGQQFSGRAISWIIDDLALGHVISSAQTMERRVNSEAVQGGACKFLFARRYRTGRAKVYHDGEVIDLHPGQYCILDYDRDCRTISADSEVLGLILPHHAVGYAPEKHPSRFIFSLDSPHGALLCDVHESLAKSAPTMNVSEAAAVAKCVKAVFASAIENYVGDAAPTVSKWDEIRRFIDEQIFEPDLTVATLTKRFGVSRATLYRQLALSGGLRSYIAGRRLDYAFRHLTVGDAQRGRISEIAVRCGYNSANQFSRAFSRRFGFNPSVVLSASQGGDAQPGEPGENTLWGKLNKGDLQVQR